MLKPRHETRVSEVSRSSTRLPCHKPTQCQNPMSNRKCDFAETILRCCRSVSPGVIMSSLLSRLLCLSACANSPMLSWTFTSVLTEGVDSCGKLGFYSLVCRSRSRAVRCPPRQRIRTHCSAVCCPQAVALLGGIHLTTNQDMHHDESHG